MPVGAGFELYQAPSQASVGLGTAVPHLAFPFTVTAGAAQVVAQDTEDEVAQCVAVLLQTRPGSRLPVPGYGVADPTFGAPSPLAIEAAIARWEPRANPTVVVTTPDTRGAGRISVTVRLRTVA